MNNVIEILKKLKCAVTRKGICLLINGSDTSLRKAAETLDKEGYICDNHAIDMPVPDKYGLITIPIGPNGDELDKVNYGKGYLITSPEYSQELFQKTTRDFLNMTLPVQE